MNESGLRVFTNLPRREAVSAEQVATGLYSDVFAVLCTYFAKLEGRAHFTVELVLLLCHLK